MLTYPHRIKMASGVFTSVAEFSEFMNMETEKKQELFRYFLGINNYSESFYPCFPSGKTPSKDPTIWAGDSGSDWQISIRPKTLPEIIKRKYLQLAEKKNPFIHLGSFYGVNLGSWRFSEFTNENEKFHCVTEETFSSSSIQ